MSLPKQSHSAVNAPQRNFLDEIMTRSPHSLRPDDDDDLYAQAVKLVLSRRDASVVLVQCYFRLGHRRACSLFERMEAEGLATPIHSTRPAWILVEHREDTAS